MFITGSVLKEKDMTRMRYNKTSSWDWNKAIPVGNGRLGGMIHGEDGMEHIQINEDSIWSGKYHNRTNKDALKNLPKIRELIFAGKIPEAERLMKLALTATPQSQTVYETAGDVCIGLNNESDGVCVVERGLDLDEGIAYVYSKSPDGKRVFKRECFSSYPDGVIVFHYSGNEKLSIDCTMSRAHVFQKVDTDKEVIYFSGATAEGAIEYVIGMSIVCTNGKVSTIGEHITCEDTCELTLYISIETSFYEENLFKKVCERLNAVKAKTYDEIRKSHVDDYKRLIGACELQIGDGSFDGEISGGTDTKDFDSVDDMLNMLKSDDCDFSIKAKLINLYFKFGRYLLISSSRPGSLPSNLQGIWNKDFTPPWGSKFTININCEMNYWPAERLGLSECHEPLFAHMKRMFENGKVTAREMYGCSGVVAHHNTDIWGDTAPQDMYNPATYWVMGFAWLCTHIWDRYEYTKDENVIKDNYDILMENARFFLDFLVEHEGFLVTVPSVSPENTYILKDGTHGCNGYGCTMDNEILMDLFKICLRAADIMNDNSDIVGKIKDALKKIPPVKIGSQGQILEWIEEYDEAEPGHRHISHLYGLFPSSQINKDETPELMDAAAVTLKRRLAHGGGHTGWSRAWMIALYARLRDGEKAYDSLISLLTNSTQPNLFDSHPPFQIDGNFGAIAAISEMLIQSHRDISNDDEKRIVHILPALPSEWKSGSIKGVHVRGGAIFNFGWKDGKVSKLSVEALGDYKAYIYGENFETYVELKKGEKKSLL